MLIDGKMSAFPKIHALGSKYSQGVFQGEVEITEKIDGSQFGFYRVDRDTIFYRSKGQTIDLDNVPNLFKPSVDHIEAEKNSVTSGYVYYGEAICKKKHNTLTYDRVPLGNIVLFAVYDTNTHTWLDYPNLIREARRIFVEAVPLLYQGTGASPESVKELINRQSFLGGVNVEGVVVKNFKDVEIAGQLYPIHSVKYVSEAFKEVHSKNPEYKSGKSKAELLFQGYNSEARFTKAVQKLKEEGNFEGDYTDISKCMKILNQDLIEECEPDIKEALWGIYRKNFIKIASKGFPQWFKDNLDKFVESE